MDDFAILPAEQRERAFHETTARRGGTFSVMEKDFWVCWALKQLYKLPEAHGKFLFKGGTSLSKVFNLIERFSEDIDVGLDRSALGFQSDHHKWEELSANKRKEAIKSLSTAADEYVTGPLREELATQMESILGLGSPRDDWSQDGKSWCLIAQSDSAGNRCLFFLYPQLPLPNAPATLYVERRVMIEIGARAAHWPVHEGAIQPYVAQEFPRVIGANFFYRNLVQRSCTSATLSKVYIPWIT